MSGMFDRKFPHETHRMIIKIKTPTINPIPIPLRLGCNSAYLVKILFICLIIPLSELKKKIPPE